MNFNLNPLDGEINAIPNGIRWTFNEAIGAWIKDDPISADHEQTSDTTRKVWAGTFGEYNGLQDKREDTVYFVKPNPI